MRKVAAAPNAMWSKEVSVQRMFIKGERLITSKDSLIVIILSRCRGREIAGYGSTYIELSERAITLSDYEFARML